MAERKRRNVVREGIVTIGMTTDNASELMPLLVGVYIPLAMGIGFTKEMLLAAVSQSWDAIEAHNKGTDNGS